MEVLYDSHTDDVQFHSRFVSGSMIATLSFLLLYVKIFGEKTEQFREFTIFVRAVTASCIWWLCYLHLFYFRQTDAELEESVVWKNDA